MSAPLVLLSPEQLSALVPENDSPEALLSRIEAARWAGCAVRTIDSWLAAGAPHVRLGGPGGSPRMLASELIVWLRERGR